ncbi:antitoxin Xre-like helix-turn-helix domain-containing protein [Desulfuromonas acetoxidans]|uniref:Uncharacterized protein n=1 Tax=Desulfuromonas acetoxidans (strain DSM 684 / 11070) TaxID=281689 RepID=Q1JW39_DESA6|nr:antitoxin Xre-like helix-turn-helix domain-containing protein [Desulfuromonas acetoxidans]EAT14449.1 conserved hypothetical protein [Desulfuromonas acetoxidans DSM 684]
MTQTDNFQDIDLSNTDSRARLAQLITRLFEHWQLSDEDQAALLGLSTKNRSTLSRYRQGKPLANNMDLLDRAGHLLSIHKSLRILYPHNRSLAYQWISRPNKRFNNMSPLEIIKERHFEGLLTISHYLDWELHQ